MREEHTGRVVRKGVIDTSQVCYDQGGNGKPGLVGSYKDNVTDYMILQVTLGSRVLIGMIQRIIANCHDNTPEVQLIAATV